MIMSFKSHIHTKEESKIDARVYSLIRGAKEYKRFFIMQDTLDYSVDMEVTIEIRDNTEQINNFVRRMSGGAYINRKLVEYGF